jgi:hypothetical protein
MAETAGKCYTFRGLKFYAKNGCVCLHDEDDGSFFVLTVKEFLERAAALSDEAKRLRQLMAANPDRKWLVQDRLELQQAIDNMVECCKEAKNQGDRSDPAVAAWFAKHRPTRRSKISLASAANFKTTLPGPLPLGTDTGKHVSPDFSFPALGAAPKKLILPGE